jgi:hypothetical protein
MKRMKLVLIPLCTLAVYIALVTADSLFSQAEKNKNSQPAKSQSVEQNNKQKPSTEKSNVIGYLQSRDKVVTIIRGEKGTIYTVKTKDGKTLAENLNEKDLETKYPVIFNQVKYGLAGNDARLYGSSVPLK